MSEKSTRIVRTSELQAAQGMPFRHPLNPRSQAEFHQLSRPTGLTRAHVNLLRVPPGKEAFILHSHAVQEEWSYIVSGTGEAQIGEEKFAVGPGDFIGFPLDGKPHTILNTGSEDLVYLTGGEDSPQDIGHFPTVGKMALFKDGAIELIDRSASKTYSLEQWIRGEID